MALQVTLAVAALITFAAAATYAHVGWKLAVRPIASEAGRRALGFFALWWLALAANIALVGVTYALAAFDVLTFEVQFVDSILQRLFLAVSMVGLMEYLLFLVTGRSFARWLAAAYSAYFALLLYAFLRAEPTGLLVTDWRTDVLYSGPQIAWAPAVALFAIILPPVAASLAYFRLFFRVEDATTKWRIALVSWAIIGWWVVAVAAGQRAALENGPLQSFQRVLSLFAALVVLAAYHPPRWARLRWGLVSDQARSRTSKSRSTSLSRL